MNPVIGIYGGTFDPVHIAHLRLAIEASEHLRLSKVIWVPSGNPAHRASPVASAQDRLAMLELAIKNHPDFAIDAADLFSDEPTYTINTLYRLRKIYPDNALVLLVGMDSFLSLPSWHCWEKLLDLAHIAVATRLNYGISNTDTELYQKIEARQADAEAIQFSPFGRIVFMPMLESDISASAIRLKAKKSLNLSYLLPPLVEDYVIRQALYR